MAIYMKIPGVYGEVTNSDFHAWIDLDSVNFTGITTPTNDIVGRGTSRAVTIPRFGAIAITKAVDKSSIALFEAAHSGKTFPSVEIDFVTTGDPAFAYEKIKLTNVMVTHYSEQKSSEDSRPQEFITLAYEQIEKTYIPRDAENVAQSPITSGFSLPQAKSM